MRAAFDEEAVVLYDERMKARVDSRGRVTIPVELRRKVGLRAGTRLIVHEEEGCTVVMTMASYVRSLRGVLKGKGILERLWEKRRMRR